MALTIGDYKLPAPVILAPMSGVTDKPFRKAVRRFGAPLLVTEMVASRSMIMQSKQSMQKCQFDHEGGLTSVQLAGCEPKYMAEAAKLNEGMGARLIDINFGCPAKKIVNSYSGSYLMRDDVKVKAAKILEATVKAVSIPVTLKMRTGWDDSNRNAPELARIAEDLGIRMITVHGRTRCQFYSGKADWGFIRQVKEAIKIPIVVNGDIKSIDDVNEALHASGADGLMIGRGAYGKPWFINQVSHYLQFGEKLADPSPEEKLATILEHYEDMLHLYGERTGVAMARKHLGWYSSGIVGSSAFRAKVNTMLNVSEVKNIIVDFFTTAQY